MNSLNGQFYWQLSLKSTFLKDTKKFKKISESGSVYAEHQA